MTEFSDIGCQDEVIFPGLKLQPEMFDAPLEFIADEHRRQKKICYLILVEQILDRLCYKKEKPLVDFIHNYFSNDLPNHIQDEEKDLFPLMREKSTAANDANLILDQVCKEHDFDRELTDFIVRDLDRLHEGHTLSDPLRLALNLQTFAEGLIRHTNWENLTIIPMAQKQLSPKDMKNLGRKMSIRRGI